MSFTRELCQNTNFLTLKPVLTLFEMFDFLGVSLTQELYQLADEVRSDVIFNVSKTGGHLGSSLGVVELTVALHYVFNAPQDRILWDVGHQVSFFSPSLLLLGNVYV